MTASLEDGTKYNIRADYYYIASSKQTCWKCHKETKVFGVIVPAGFEEIDYEDDPPVIQEYDEAAFVTGIGMQTPEVEAHLRLVSPRFFVDASETTESIYWMNHCEYCGMKQGDFFLYSEPDGAFFPTCAEEKAKINVRRVDEPFRVWGDIRRGTADDIVN